MMHIKLLEKLYFVTSLMQLHMSDVTKKNCIRQVPKTIISFNDYQLQGENFQTKSIFNYKISYSNEEIDDPLYYK